MGFVYLVQPAVLRGTNRYKIGMSMLDNMSRFKAYGSNTRIMITIECKHTASIEKSLIAKFNEYYDCIAGNEYFEVNDESKMVSLFVDTVMNQMNRHDIPTADEWMQRFGLNK